MSSGLLSAAASLCAAEIHVPADHPTIQGAINASADGDVISIAAGTYFENIRLFGKAITLRGAGIDLTTIDGSAATEGIAFGSTIRCVDGEGPGTVIEDLTVTGGTGTNIVGSPFAEKGEVGGGLYAPLSAPTIRRLRFTGNQAGRGAGLYMTTPSVPYQVFNCEFVDNSGEGEGGIRIVGASSILLEDCLVARNHAFVSAAGATLIADEVIVRRCRFEENLSAESFGIGAGLSLIDQFGVGAGQVLVEDSLFRANRAVAGAAIVALQASIVVRRSLFVGNFAASFGGGIVADQSDLTVEQCVFAGNEAANASSITVSNTDNASIAVDHCTFYGELGGPTIQPYFSPVTVTNSIGWQIESQVLVDDFFSSMGEVTFSNVDGGATGLGNISVDPQFVNPGALDFTLAPTSPCIDAGDPTFPLDPDGSVTDMGADFSLLPDFFIPVFRRGDANLDGAIDVADPLAILGDFFFGGSPILCVSAADGNDDGVLDLADPIYLLNYLFQEGPEPPAPLDCGVDPTPDTSCEAADTGC